MPGRTQQEIEQWIVERIRTRLGDEEIDVHAPLIGYGLDSMQVVALATELEEYTGVRFDENPLFDHPTIDDLSRYLAQRSGGNGRPDPPRESRLSSAHGETDET